MHDVDGGTAVAVVPCYNEGQNPSALADALLAVPDLHAVFVDDGSDDESRRALDLLAVRDSRIRVIRSEVRRGKVASLRDVFAMLDRRTQRVLLVDCDVKVAPRALALVLDELRRCDLVVTAPTAISSARSWWERGAIFSANRHDRLRRFAISRYPALFSNGRLLGLSRRLVDAIAAAELPPHTEDAHFMLVCIDRGYRFVYLDSAVVSYRAPDTLDDYLRQSNRFSAGRELLRLHWSNEMLARYYDPRPYDVAATLLAEALHDPLGAAAFSVMLAAKGLQPRTDANRSGAWPVAASTKSVR